MTKIAYIVGLFVLGTCGVFVASHRVMSKQGAEMEAVQNAVDETKPAAKLEAVQKTYEEEEEEAAELQASGLIEKEANEGGMEGSITCKSWCIVCENDHRIFVERASSNKQLFGSAAKVGAVGIGAAAGGVVGAIGGGAVAAAGDYGADKLSTFSGTQGADCAKVRIYDSRATDGKPTADSKVEGDHDFHEEAKLAVLRMQPNVERFVEFMEVMSHEKICDGSKAKVIKEFAPRVLPKWKKELRRQCLANLL